MTGSGPQSLVRRRLSKQLQSLRPQNLWVMHRDEDEMPKSWIWNDIAISGLWFQRACSRVQEYGEIRLLVQLANKEETLNFKPRETADCRSKTLRNRVIKDNRSCSWRNIQRQRTNIYGRIFIICDTLKCPNMLEPLNEECGQIIPTPTSRLWLPPPGWLGVGLGDIYGRRNPTRCVRLVVDEKRYLKFYKRPANTPTLQTNESF